MTLEQAIEFCFHMEEEQYKSGLNAIIGDYPAYKAAPHFRLASEYKQIAEWLKELKDLIKEKDELLKKLEQITEYKRLLRAAICETCEYYDIFNRDACEKDGCYKLQHIDKVLALIGEEDKNNGV